MHNAHSRILLIDDEDVVLDACTRMLRGGDYEVATELDGARGVTRAREFRPDLVIVDLKMPGLSGLEVLDQIQAFDPSIVSIILTGYATVGSAVDAMKKGAHDFLPKPITPDEFRRVVARALERRRLILETQRLRREKELLREQFAAIVSHELKTPLSALQQHLFVLADDLREKLSEAQRQQMERMKTRVADLMHLIQTWLRLISADLTKLRERFAPVPIDTLVAKAVESVQTHAQRKNIRLRVETAAGIGAVQGDEGTLVQALVNLLDNAVKYSQPGAEAWVLTTAEPGSVRIAVKDTGIGIAAEDLPRVFEDFYRGGATAGEPGCGLGLPLTRRIIEAHGGSITAESQPGKGSTFVLRLPLPPASPG